MTTLLRNAEVYLVTACIVQTASSGASGGGGATVVLQGFGKASRMLLHYKR